MNSYIKVTRTRSTITQALKIRKVIESGLGLRKIGVTKVYKDNNCIRGMVNKVKHLVSYELFKK